MITIDHHTIPKTCVWFFCEDVMMVNLDLWSSFFYFFLLSYLIIYFFFFYRGFRLYNLNRTIWTFWRGHEKLVGWEKKIYMHLLSNEFHTQRLGYHCKRSFFWQRSVCNPFLKQYEKDGCSSDAFVLLKTNKIVNQKIVYKRLFFREKKKRVKKMKNWRITSSRNWEASEQHGRNKEQLSIKKKNFRNKIGLIF